MGGSPGDAACRVYGRWVHNTPPALILLTAGRIAERDVRSRYRVTVR